MPKTCLVNKLEFIWADSVNQAKIKIIAALNNWRRVYEFIENFVSSLDISKSEISKILLSCEEVFVNVSRYAYPQSMGSIEVEAIYLEDSSELKITFKDSGVPFDPTVWEPENLNMSPSKRKIGGLGIFMVKSMMDKMEYEYIDNTNKLVIIKKINLGGC